VTGTWFLTGQDGTSYSWTTAVDEFALKIAPFYPAATLFNQAILYHRVSGIYLPVDSYSPATTTHGSSSAGQKANQCTFTFRDAAFNLDRIQLMGTNNPAPFKVAGEGRGGSLGAFVTSVEGIAAGQIGWWYRSKDNQFIKSAIWITSCLNKKSRRRLSL